MEDQPDEMNDKNDGDTLTHGGRVAAKQRIGRRECGHETTQLQQNTDENHCQNTQKKQLLSRSQPQICTNYSPIQFIK